MSLKLVVGPLQFLGKVQTSTRAGDIWCEQQIFFATLRWGAHNGNVNFFQVDLFPARLSRHREKNRPKKVPEHARKNGNLYWNDGASEKNKWAGRNFGQKSSETRLKFMLEILSVGSFFLSSTFCVDLVSHSAWLDSKVRMAWVILLSRKCHSLTFSLVDGNIPFFFSLLCRLSCCKQFSHVSNEPRHWHENWICSQHFHNTKTCCFRAC